MRPRFAVATADLNLPIKASIKTVATWRGIQGIKLDLRNEIDPTELSQTGQRELLHFLKEVGLQISAVSFPVRKSFYDLDNLDRRLTATKQALELAGSLRVPILSLRIGTIPAEQAAAEYGLLCETISDLARLGNRVGVTLAVIPGPEPLPQLREFLSEIRSGPIGIDFDPARALLAAGQPAQRLRDLHDYIVEFTAHDAVRDFAGGTEETVLGRGEIVWDEMLATLDEIDYRGWITLQRNQGDQRREDLERSLQYLTTIINEF